MPHRDCKFSATPANHVVAVRGIEVKSKEAPPASMMALASASGPSSMDMGCPSAPMTTPPEPSRSNGRRSDVSATVSGCIEVNSRFAREMPSRRAKAEETPMARLSPVHALWNPASARIRALDWMEKISPDCTSRAINPFAVPFFMTMSRTSISPRRGIFRLMHCSSKIERTSRSVESPVPAVLGLDWPGNCPR